MLDIIARALFLIANACLLLRLVIEIRSNARISRDIRQAEAVKMPPFVKDRPHLLEYEIRAEFSDGVHETFSEWRRWFKAGDGHVTGWHSLADGASNVWIVGDIVRDTKLRHRLAGIRIRNATGAGERTARHAVGFLAGDAVEAMNDLMLTERPASMAGCKQLDVLKHEAGNRIVTSIDNMIDRYEGLQNASDGDK